MNIVCVSAVGKNPGERLQHIPAEGVLTGMRIEYINMQLPPRCKFILKYKMFFNDAMGHLLYYAVFFELQNGLAAV